MTGTVFLRSADFKKDGKNIFMVCGVIGLSEEEALQFQGETQYTIKNIELVDPVDRKEIAKGNGLDGLVKLPIWRT